MAAPGVTARVLPTGYKLPEGFKAAIAFSLRPQVNIWEVEVAPAGVQVAEINTSTQLNITWMTKWLSALKESKDVAGQAGYDPDAMDDLVFLCGAQSGSFTINAPNGTKFAYWGACKDFTFQAWRAGQFPMLTYANVVTNYDPVNKVEAGPATTQAAGT